MIIGMDFGTTNSGISVYDGQHLQLIPIDSANQNATIARTALYITNDRQIYIGRQAIDTYYEQNLNRPARFEQVWVGEITLTFAEIGTFVRDVFIEKDVLSPGRLFLSFKMGLSSLNYLGTVVGSHFYFLEDIIATYLYIARMRAEQHLQREIKQIVLGRPVRYSYDAEENKLAQERMLKAAFKAGFEDVYLQYEPIAAAYHYESTIEQGEQNVLIFDFGGGTLDLSIIRVGNPKTRAVLANGGLPIAGDVFDQKIVREKLPPYFGEGSYYRVGKNSLKVPSSFYEAFSNWQDMLALNRPDFFESIKRIEQTAQRPHQIRALEHLISSNYGLQMFDIVEATKRELSSNTQAMIKLDGEDFTVRQLLTRLEFERIIRSDILDIDAYLDEMLQQAGLRADQIDAIIRTGGSSQIPAFVDMLERRFGKDKVRSLDVFSSVTSGLGIIGHQIETGQIDAQVHHSKDYAEATNNARNGLPAIDFEVLKKYITFTETQAEPEPPARALVTLSDDNVVSAALVEADTLDTEGLHLDQTAQLIALPADDRVLLATSDYRFTLKTPRQLVSLRELGLNLAETEGFKMDVFGDEHVTGMMHWEAFTPKAWALLISSGGYFKTFQAEPLIARVEQPVMYTVPRLKGDPLQFIERPENGEVVLFSSSGRAVRIGSALLQDLEGRVMNVPSRDRVIAAFALSQPTQFVVASAAGQVACLDSADLPLAQNLNSTGAKVVTWRTLQSVGLMEHVTQVVTTYGLRPLDDEALQKGKISLKKDESLVGLV